MRWYSAATENRYIWPHRVQEDVIDLEIAGVTKNNEDIIAEWNSPAKSHDIPNTSASRWDIFECNKAWTKTLVNMRLFVQDYQSVIASVVPPEQNAQTALALCMKCNNTRLRIAKVQSTDDGAATINLDLDRFSTNGEVVLTPYLILSKDFENPSLVWAKKKSSIIATGKPFSIWVDKPLDRPGRGLDIKWEKFPENAQNALYHLIIDPDEFTNTKLYINNRFLHLKPVLDSTTRSGEISRLRDAFFGFIYVDVWLQLANYAAKNDDEENSQHRFVDNILRELIHITGLSRQKIKDSFTDEDALIDLNLALQHSKKIAELSDDLSAKVREILVGGD